MDSPSPAPSPGITLHGRVLLEERVDGDGSVSVHRGHDTVADVPVTVTLLEPRLAAEPAVAHAFLGRAQTLAALDAPHLVRVLGDGRDGDHVYLVTEATPGETLSEVLGGGDQGLRYSPHMALSIVADVLTALREAHDAGLVHGHLTPDDVVMDDDGGVTVTGFGLVGVEELTPRTDVHAVGMLLHSLMTGSLRAQEGESLRPSSVVPGLPPDLDMLVANATEPNPRYRPRDAGQYLNLVEQVLRSLPAPAEAGDATQPIPVVGAEAATGPGPGGPDGTGRDAGAAPPLWRRVPVLVTAGVLVLALFAAGWALAPEGAVELPDLTGFSPEMAEAELAALELDLSFDYADTYSDEVEPGEVALTDPAAGTELWGGESILLSLSVGPQYAEIPDVVGGTENDARNLLREAGFTVVEVVQEHSSDQAPGTVLSSVPEAGEDGDRDEAVTLHVSEGVLVPNLIGMGQTEAAGALVGLGLSVALVEAAHETAPEGEVSGQDPEPGAILPEGGTVTLTVSTGPEEAEEEEEPEEDVPSEDSDTSESSGPSEGPEGGTGGGPQEPPGASCSGEAWNQRTVYQEGDRVHHGGRVYEARWWIQGMPPNSGGEWGPWSDQGPC